MLQIEYVKGNLIDMTEEGMFDAVCHGCNCFNNMGSGIAPQLNNMTNGELLKVDRATIKGDINKLGKVTYVHHHPRHASHKIVRVFNIYTQHVYQGLLRAPKSLTGGVTLVNWDALLRGLQAVLSASGPNPHVGIPLIGCGLAGGSRFDFERVLTHLQEDDELEGTITVVEFDG